MSAIFPERFDFREFGGSRTKHFQKPSDAFQQLVGDGLKTTGGRFVIVCPTRAGPDGSIDAFIEPGSQTTGPFSGLELPAVVECKQHDDESSSVWQNVKNEWKKVAKKLTKQAQLDWPGNFSPWRQAQSYVYCVSALLPNPADRKALAGKIQKFFDDLPPGQRPPLKSIRVLDWSDLRPWLESIPVVSDAWLGVGFSAVVDHQTQLARLSGFKTFLLDSKLKFVPPDQAHSWQPAKVMEQLEAKDNQPGIILVGVGGVGKTRTCFEVANSAAGKNWRVLHIEPGEPAVTVEVLASVILPQPARTLLVFDYLDQMQYLDLGALRRRLIPQLIERGGEVRLLANCRPNWLRIPNPERDQLFAPVHIRPDAAQNRKITKVIVETVAATASGQIGADEVMRVCGDRPIIALLIARELERRALHSGLKKSDFETLRTGDLTHWLRRRLAEDQLVAGQEQSLLSRPPAPVVAAAAALACAPGPPEALVFAAQLSLESLHYDRPKEGKRLVDVLLQLGWLEQQANRIGTAHDVVADEVIEQVLVDGGTVRESEFEAVLAITSRVPRSIGRLALALRRVIGAIVADESALCLQGAAVSWLKRNAIQLGDALASGDPDTTGFALGQVIAGPPWNDCAMEMWEKLIEPWVKSHGCKEEARHLIYKGLKDAGSNYSPKLTEAALNWLAANAILPAATFVIGPLLEQNFPEADKAKEAIGYALRWLEKDNHWERLDAGFVLSSLLAQKHLEADKAKEAIGYALRWLEKDNHWERLDAQFVLSSLLAQKHLEADKAKEAIGYALRWLPHFEIDLTAQFVLHHLLKRPELAESEAEDVLRRALTNLGEHLGGESATFILRWCLQRRIGDTHLNEKIVALAVNWLRLNPEHTQADYVFNRVLRRPNISASDWQFVASVAMRWLNAASHSLAGRDHTLNSLFARFDALSPEDLKKVVRDTISFLKKSNKEADDERLVANLQKLKRTLPGGHELIPEIKHALSSKPLSNFDELLERLNESANDESLATDQVVLVQEGCEAMRAAAARSPNLAAFAIPPLLVIASRIGSESLNQVEMASKEILSHPRFYHSSRKKVAEACFQFLSNNAFGNSDSAEELFRRLGLNIE